MATIYAAIVNGVSSASSPTIRPDNVIGSNQNDIFYVDSRDTVTGGAGYDKAYYGPRFVNEFATITNFSGVEEVYVLGSFGNVKVVANVENNKIFILTSSGNAEVYAGLGDDFIQSNIGNRSGRYFGESGRDAIYSFGTGNSYLDGGEGVDFLFSGSGNDTLDGGLGADNLIGGLGNDIYVVDDMGDRITEQANQGTDTVLTSLSSFDLNATNNINLENLSFTGTANFTGLGNALNNVITGNVGNDTLSGGLGADALIGGLGNDTYVVDDAGDVITELANQGTDTVLTSLSSFDLNATNNINLENLSYTGTDNFTGLGNSLSNVITGNIGNDTLSGGIGADSVIGGAGILDTGNDTIIAGAGDDVLFGIGGDDILIGGLGSDMLYGGLGADVFSWSLADVASNAMSLDKVLDFDKTAASDKLDLKDLLIGESSTVNSLDNYLHFDFDPTNGSTTVSINAHGGFVDGGVVNGQVVGAIDQQIQLVGVNLIGDFLTDAQVINNLLAQQKLITDIA